MVPGSTLIYGSSFCIRTFSPRPSSNMPIEALVSPLPSELTTPPVTKMNLVIAKDSNPLGKIRFYRRQTVLQTVGDIGRKVTEQPAHAGAKNLFEPSIRTMSYGSCKLDLRPV